MRLGRKSDTSTLMLMVNTILFGVGLGLVVLSWVKFVSEHNSLVEIYSALLSLKQPMLLVTVAVLLGGFFHSITVLYPQLKKKEQEKVKTLKLVDGFRDQAYSDPLTELQNRRYFDLAVNAYLTEFKAIGATFGLLLLDLDHFKQINDEYGHEAGDVTLKEVAHHMKNMAREHDIVARIGGEEFAVVVPFADKDDLSNIAERYRREIDNLNIIFNNQHIPVTASVGVSENTTAESLSELLTNADTKLYEAKNMGRNRIAA